MERFMFLIEWTHGDGMDQHEECAMLTGTEAMTIQSLLNDLGADNPHVYEPMATSSFNELIATIKNDLGVEKDEA